MLRMRSTRGLPVLLLVGALGMVGRAQTPATATFEVASIKLNRSGQEWSTFGTSRGGRLTAVNSTVRELVRVVYAVHDFQIEGGPGWFGSERYDIVAKAEGELPPLTAPIPGQDPPLALMMMRSLLAER